MMQPAPSAVQPPMDPSQYQQQHQQQHQHQHQQWFQHQQQQQQQQPSQYQQQAPQQSQFQHQPPMYYHQQQPPQAAAPPQLQQQQQQPQYTVAATAQPASADEIRTLWIGDLQYWMDENFLLGCFGQSGEVVSAKVIRNKSTGQSDGYGFIEFVNRSAAERHLQMYNGTLMPNVEQNFRLNWASFGVGEKRPDDVPDYTIFVGDLAGDVTDYMLQETFRTHYPSVKGAKVVTDRDTSRPKGYGFVKFGEESEQLRAMTEMNGKLCSTRPMRIGPAANKKSVGTQQYPKAPYHNTQGTQSEDDPNNTTIFVGGLDSNVTDEHLKQVFSPYGQLVHVKIPVGKRCGFVQFADRTCAEEALRMLNGTQLGGQNVRLSWGRSPSNKQVVILRWIQTSGMVVGIMDMDRDMKLMDMPLILLPKILIFTMEAILVMEIIPKTSSPNNHSDLLVCCIARVFTGPWHCKSSRCADFSTKSSFKAFVFTAS